LTLRGWRPALLAGPALAVALGGGSGCIRVKTDPIHITMDVNLRVQKDLDNFFGDIDKPASAAPAPQPAGVAPAPAPVPAPQPLPMTKETSK